MNDWTSTRLYLELDKSSSSQVSRFKVLLENVMPKIQSVLAKAGTARLDFTLHDADHSYRVAERMIDLIPSDVLPKLSPYELTLLLLSAYLHDIGMSPERRKVEGHFEYLVTGTSQDINPDEAFEFQAWLDNQEDGIIPPIEIDNTSKQLRKAEGIVTDYARYKHNDWSEGWIRNHAALFGVEGYPLLVDDLVKICRSHHEQYNDLVSERFNPRLIGSVGEILHSRYLAVVLRMADVLEFDPERTPDIIRKHRAVREENLIYWYKDHQISFKLDGETKKTIVLSATPDNAYVHKAIETMASQIELEAQTCRTLADQTHFETCPGLSVILPHRWDLLGNVNYQNITPRDNSYVYINGSFRPDTNKLLELLSGVELYGNPMAAVRELLQNAFDAVREQIARKRLLLSNPLDERACIAIRTLNDVELSIQDRDGECWLLCRDSGVGMTKDIISNHLLVSGLSKRHEILDLERRCVDAGFNLERTGQFGIGVLSYFMLADKVIITTKRSQDANPDSLHGWKFETDGVGSFGELRPVQNCLPGTEVALRLRPEITNRKFTRWQERLRSYVSTCVNRLPCKLKIKLFDDDIDVFAEDTAWASQPKDYSESVVKHSIYNADSTEISLSSFVPADVKKARATARIQLENAEKLAGSSLHWYVAEGELPYNYGHYRLLVPYFILQNGSSLLFFHLEDIDNTYCIKTFNGQNAFRPFGRSRSSWRGMMVDNSFSEDYDSDAEYDSNEDATAWLANAFHAVLEIDWTHKDAGNLSVNRNSFELSFEGIECLEELWDIVSSHMKKCTGRFADSPYSYMNARAIYSLPGQQQILWLAHDINKAQAGSYLTIKPIQFPCVSSEHIFLYNELSPKSLGWKEFNVTVVQSIISKSIPANRCRWYDANISPTHMLIYPESSGILLPLWSKLEVKQPRIEGLFECVFPPEYNDVIYVAFAQTGETFLNSNNHLTRVLTQEDWLVATQIEEDDLEDESVQSQILSRASLAAGWIICCMQAERDLFWRGLVEKYPDFVKSIWELLRVASRSKKQIGTLKSIQNHNTREFSMTNSKNYLSIADTFLAPKIAEQWQIRQD